MKVENQPVMKQILLSWFKIQASKSARTELKKYYDRKATVEILDLYWRRYKKSKVEIPKMPTIGGSVTVNLAAMSASFYDELIFRGRHENETTQMFYNIAWRVYFQMGKFSWWLASKRKATNFSRLKKTTELFRSFPFNSPSYKWKDIQTESNVVGFDCLKCPVADYFKTKRLSKFCTNTWCKLDYPLAELWHTKLERTGSIAGGADKCDFRWTVKDNPL